MNQSIETTKGRNFRKFVFFYLILNLIAYSTFLLKFHPKSESDEKDSYYNDYTKTQSETFTKIYDYILIPDYKILERCTNCDLKEADHFYPFHKFTYGFGSGGYNNYSQNFVRNETKGFVGIFGFYGHTEFVFYVIIPFLIFGLIKVYKKFVG